MNREQALYIGITGFMSKAEVEHALAWFPHSARILMIGILASSKTLRDETNKWPHRYPRIGDIPKMLEDYPRALNVIHYSTDDQSTLDDQLTQLVNIAGDNLHGIQLNVVWPDPEQLECLDQKVERLILQIGTKALEMYGNDPQRVASALCRYEDRVTDILIDPSGGKGIPFDPVKVKEYIAAIDYELSPMTNIGVAGGLCASTLESLVPIVLQCSDINIDAEGKLRNEQDHLVPLAVREYLRGAVEVLGNKR